MSDAERNLEVYAEIVAALGVGADRDALLAKHGLDEASFQAMEDEIEAEFSRAMEVEGDNVPPFFQKYEAAMRNGQAKVLGGRQLSLEQFARGVAAVSRSGDPVRALERIGMSSTDLVRALAHWGKALAQDPELAAKFEAIRTGKKR